MDRFVVRIASESREIEAALPADLPISALLAGVVQMTEGRFPSEAEAHDWALEAPDGIVIPAGDTLRQHSIPEGATLRLVRQLPVPAGVSAIAEPTVPAPEPLVPGVEPAMPGYDETPVAGPPPPDSVPEFIVEDSANGLPTAVPLGDRLKAVAGALVSTSTEEVAVDPEPGAVDRLAVQRQASPLQRAQQAWEATDYKRRLDAFIAAPRLTRCVTIAVVSPKGGVGKTTTAILLGTMLATLRSDRVVAVDTDPDYGTLGRSFAPANPMYVDDLGQLLHQPALTATMLDRFLSRAAHGLMILPAPVDPERMDSLGRDDYARVVEGLKSLVGILVLDCGAGMRAPATRAALDAADQLVLVTDADPATASLVADVAHRFHDRPHVLVVNKSPRRGGRLNLERLAEDVPEAGAVVEVDADPTAAETVSLGQFNWSVAQDGWQLAARELAAHLTAGWEKLGATG